MDEKPSKKRYQVTISDPKICALLDMYPREKGKIIEESLELFLKTDNKYTRQLKKMTEQAAENLRLLSSLTGDQVRVLEDVGKTTFLKEENEPEEEIPEEDMFDESDLRLM